jgi:hypothetical protein
MKRFYLAALGSLGLMLGAAAWPSASSAQGYCYLVDATGQVVNLDDLCQSDRQPSAAPDSTANSNPPETQADLQVEGANDGAVQVNRVTIVGPATSDSATSVGNGDAGSSTPATVTPPGGADLSETASPQVSTPAESSPNQGVSEAAADDPAAPSRGSRVIVTPSGVQILN